jgi:starch phosphorylase
MIRVELFADGVNGGSAVRQEMTRLRPLADGSGGYTYSATVSSARPASDYTARIIPHEEGLGVPLEDAHIRWQQ